MDNLSYEQKIFAKQVGQLIDHIFEQGYTCTLGEAHRSQEQADIYAKEGKGIHDSLHCKSLAIDLNLFDSSGNYLSRTDDYRTFGTWWKFLDDTNRWGGDFPRADGNHFQRGQ